MSIDKFKKNPKLGGMKEFAKQVRAKEEQITGGNFVPAKDIEYDDRFEDEETHAEVANYMNYGPGTDRKQSEINKEGPTVKGYDIVDVDEDLPLNQPYDRRK